MGAGVPDLMHRWRIKGEGVGEVVELGIVEGDRVQGMVLDQDG